LDLSDKTLAKFSDSLGRAEANAEFLSLFYAKFLAASPEVEQKFEGVDMRRQARMLMGSMRLILLASQGDQGAKAQLENVAAKHSKSQADIQPELYDLWIDTLIETVEEIDPEFTLGVKQAWRDMMNFGVRCLKGGYDK